MTPLKPLEAMASGIPVLASDVAALREIVEDGETGMLFRAGDAESAAGACIRLGRDTELRKRLSENALKWATSERTWDVLTKRYIEVYENLVRR